MSSKTMVDAKPTRLRLERMFELGLTPEYMSLITDVSEPVLRAIRNGHRDHVRESTEILVQWASDGIDKGHLVPPLAAYRRAPSDLVCANGHLVETWNRAYEKARDRYSCRTCINANRSRWRWRKGVVRTASEEPIDMSILKSLSTRRHYGWKWQGTETVLLKQSEKDGGPYVMCRCLLAGCGLIATLSMDCTIHKHMRLANAKQSHWAKDCPGHEE